MQDRWYQTESVAALFSFFRDHLPKKDEETGVFVCDNPVIALPTGTGKSIVIARFIQTVFRNWPGQRVLMLTRSSKLVEQNYKKLLGVWPQAPVGIYAAKLKRKETGLPITFATIQSVMRAPQKFGKVDLIIIDECQDVSPEDETGYKKTISFLAKVNPFIRVIGLSATPYRLGLGLITDGGIFTHIAYDATTLEAFNRFIEEGFLVPLIPFKTDTVFDLTGVKKRGGEYVDKDIQEAMSKRELTEQAVDETIEKAKDRKHWLFFSQGIDHAEMIVEILRERGIAAASYHSKMSPLDQEDALMAFETGQLRALVNGDMLTTGYDFPALDCIILLRATESPGLLVQILGRGTRPFFANGFNLDEIEGRLQAILASEKQDCLVLDFAGNISRLGPINDVKIPKRKGEGTGDIPVKTCDHCGCLNHISARFCANKECGQEFTFKEKLTIGAAEEVIIAKKELPLVEEFFVTGINYSKHEKISSVPCLRVDYFCGVRRFTEYVMIEHQGSAQIRARKWWADRYPANDYPPSVDAALTAERYLRVPTKIRVWLNKNKGGKHPEILASIF